ncbi:NCS2 family permease [Suttonella indologenes]|uniref:Probable adenine permease PurP n=1 Tax=Suttonella indologenes TaxID=13276 RepID=A0A380MYR5_9GAMM|nr:NCS2 family permease [Suttonella indologenes]SUO97428.1 Probable adenine permease PurP [Suttonella indologenes]
MLNKLFALDAHKTTARTEFTAGLTTFLTMAYIIFVNPSILAQSGMDSGAVFVATCIAAAVGCFIMGFAANLPVALAPGMGLNAFFTFTVVLGMGKSWQIALGAVFLSGILFILISLFKIREWLINAIPNTLKRAIAAGIGGFLMLIAFKQTGIIVDNPATLVSLGNLTHYTPLMTFFCFFLIIVLESRHIRGGVLIAILATSVISILCGHTEFNAQIISAPPSLAPTFMQMDIMGALSISMISVIFAFFFVDLFDTAGTLVGVTNRAGLIATDGKIPNLKRALLADSGATIVGAALGTSNTTSYIESASGVAAGGRTGLTAVAVGIFFLCAIFFSPLAGMVPIEATSGAILYVSVLMMYALGDIDWNDISEAAPAAITVMGMTLTYSIADGISLGFIAYAVIKSLTGKMNQVSISVWVITLILIARLVLMATQFAA